MKVLQEYNRVEEYALWRDKISLSETIGFVPTMGALHEGHLKLVKQSLTENEHTVVSIFVNPKQFNNQNDLKHYPRTQDDDVSSLTAIGCDVVFIPSEKEVYPDDQVSKIDLGGMDLTMEGKFRPGHFQGVAAVVRRLFEIIRPTHAYFGEKDFQQLCIIQHMVESLQIPVQIVACETIREPSGLAMSSRNRRLSLEELNAAPLISKGLFNLDKLQNLPLAQAIEKVKKEINASGQLNVEYLSVVDAATLSECEQWGSALNKRACIAVLCGAVRLIDNVKINS